MGSGFYRHPLENLKFLKIYYIYINKAVGSKSILGGGGGDVSRIHLNCFCTFLVLLGVFAYANGYGGGLIPPPSSDNFDT